MDLEGDKDWSKASARELCTALMTLANSLGGSQQDILEAAAEQLWRLAELEE